MSLVNWLLLGLVGIGQARASGHESATPVTRSVLGSLNRRVARAYNQHPQRLSWVSKRPLRCYFASRPLRL